MKKSKPINIGIGLTLQRDHVLTLGLIENYWIAVLTFTDDRDEELSPRFRGATLEKADRQFLDWLIKMQGLSVDRWIQDMKESYEEEKES